MIHLRTKIIILLALLLVVVGSPPVAAAPSSQLPTFEPATCMFEIPFVSFMQPEQMGFECGYVTAPLYHTNPSGPTVRLPVAILRARGQSPRPDPLFLAQGGPGGDAFSVFAMTAANSPLAQERDIVIFNQRGTLYAEPSLVCTETFEAMDDILSLPPAESLARSQQAYRDCHQRLLAEGIDLSAFNSLQNAADVDAIRRALGYDVINFYGVSYGTLLGLHLMRNFPDGLRTVILDSVVPTQINYITQVPRVTERIFDKMLDTCATHLDECLSGQYPGLEQQFTDLIDRLNRQPVTIPVKDPETGQTVQLYVDGTTLMNMLFQAFYLPEMYAVFPRLISDTAAGRYDFWQNLWPVIAFDRTFSEGMFYAVICAEDSDFKAADVLLSDIRPEIAAYARDDLQDFLDVCQTWNVAQLPPAVDAPVESTVPTLLLAGQFDPITPPSFAEAAASYLPNSQLIIDPVASHGVAFNDACLDGVLQAFLDDPSRRPDDTCVQQKQPDSLVSPNALVVPLLGQINMLDGWALAQTGLAGLFLAVVLSVWVIWPLVLIINLLRNAPRSPQNRWLGWAAKGVILLFGGLAVIFVGGVIAFMMASISSTPLLLLSAVSGWSAPLFVIPFVLALLAVAALALAVLAWGKGLWSVWGRLYYSVVAAGAVAYVVMLAVTGMFSVLL